MFYRYCTLHCVYIIVRQLHRSILFHFRFNWTVSKVNSDSDNPMKNSSLSEVSKFVHKLNNRNAKTYFRRIPTRTHKANVMRSIDESMRIKRIKSWQIGCRVCVFRNISVNSLKFLKPSVSCVSGGLRLVSFVSLFCITFNTVRLDGASIPKLYVFNGGSSLIR